MEANKENIKKLLSTKIPLPKEPLPPLPTHLLNSKDAINQLKKRIPLRTLNSLPVNICLPSTSKPVKPDIRDVKLRQRSEDLENFAVVESRHTVLTPMPRSTALESRTVKNIKRSLKRPHSRELLGVHKQTKAEEKSIFNIDLTNKLQVHHVEQISKTETEIRDYYEDIFLNLLASEAKPQAVPRVPSITRACIINWLMKVNGANGNPAVVQTAIWYLDLILGTTKVDLDNLQVIATACLWIGQKVHGPYLSAAKLVAYSRNAFFHETLLSAEKEILSHLKFPPQPVVPQEFITFLSWWCDSANPGEIEVAATFLCMSGLMVDKSLCTELPSAIAAASVYNAVLLLRKKQLVERLQNCMVYKEIQKKTTDLSKIRLILRKAIRTITSPVYEYKTPFKHYEAPPLNISQRVVDAAKELLARDTKIILLEKKTSSYKP